MMRIEKMIGGGGLKSLTRDPGTNMLSMMSIRKHHRHHHHHARSATAGVPLR